MSINLNRADDWNVYAGGTGAAEGRNSYDKYVPGVGQYSISPVCWPHSCRHRGYVVTIANIYGKLSDQPGLYRWLADHPVTLPKARALCQAHYLEHKPKTPACPESDDGEHDFQVDLEYDSTGQTTNYANCGEPEE
jgi:hypothetical protein